MKEQCIILSTNLEKRLKEAQHIQDICFANKIGWMNSNFVYRKDHAYLASHFSITSHRKKGKRLSPGFIKKKNILIIEAAAFILKYIK